MSKEKNNHTDPNLDIFDSGQIKYLIDNRFHIKKKLGQGGMGEIFLAEDTKLKRMVAIKSISKENLADKDSKIRFLREAQTASQIEHPNICPIYEIYEEEKNNYIVMQYIDGVTLDNIIRYNELDIKKILNISIQICDGMIEAHSIGIVHRDLKPGNVMVNKKGNVKLLDFGLAKFRDDSDTRKHGISNSNLTEKGIVIGTVSYMSPEQAKGEPLDFRNDIFSFGVIMFEMAEGYNPFYDKEQITTLYNVLNKDIIFKKNPDKSLNKIIKKCLMKKREERYSSFEEIKKDLLRIRSKISGKGMEDDESGRTEIIDLHEKEELMKEIGKSSSIEDLGDIVYRIKKIKTETVPVISTKRNFFKKNILIISSVILMFLFLIIGTILKKNGNGSLSSSLQYITIHPFSGDGSDLFKRELLFLLKEGFDNVKNLNSVDEEAILSLHNSVKALDNRTNVKEKFNINYDLKVKITKIKNIYNFDAILQSNIDGKKRSITVPGLDSDESLLDYQIKTLIERVLKKIYKDRENKGISINIVNTYGKSWNDFQNFYKGIEYFKKFNIPYAKKYFLQSKDIPASSYYLSNLLYFNGDRIRSKKLISKIIPKIDMLNEVIKLKILSLKARLDLNFSEEIKYLIRLKNLNPLSKESYYELGEAFFHRGDAKNALKYYLGAIKLDKNFSKALNHTGYCYSYLGDHERSIEFFELYRDLDKSANSFDSLGDGYFYSGDLLSAEASKLTALKMEEKGVYWANLTLADIYLLKIRIEDSLKATRKYSEFVIEPFERAGGLSKEAFIYYYIGNYKKAIKIINKSLNIYNSNDISNNSSEEHWIKGLILLKSGKISLAQKELEWLEKLVDKNKLSIRNYLAPLKYMLHLKAELNSVNKHFDEAESAFRSLLNLKYRLSYWITQYNFQFFITEYAKFLFKTGKTNDALSQLEICLELGNKYIPALLFKAKILDYKNMKAESLKVFKIIDSLLDSRRDKTISGKILSEKLKSDSKI